MSVVIDEVIGRVEAKPEQSTEGGQREDKPDRSPCGNEMRRLVRRLEWLEERLRAT